MNGAAEVSGSKGFLDKWYSAWRAIVMEPGPFFDRMAKTGGYKEPVLFVVPIYVFLALVGMVINIVIGNPQFWVSLIYPFISLAVLFAVSGITHLWVMAFKGGHGYETTLRTVAYTNGLSLFTVIFNILFAVFLYSQTVMVLGLIGLMALGVWGVVVQIIGIKRTQELSLMKSIWTNILTIICVTVVLVIILIITNPAVLQAPVVP